MNCLNATADADPEASTNVIAHLLTESPSGYASIDQTLPTTETLVSMSTMGASSPSSAGDMDDKLSRSRFNCPFQSEGIALSTRTLDPSLIDLVTLFGPPIRCGLTVDLSHPSTIVNLTSTVSSSFRSGPVSLDTSPIAEKRVLIACNGVMSQVCPKR